MVAPAILLGACHGPDATAPVADDRGSEAVLRIDRLDTDTITPGRPFVIEGMGFTGRGDIPAVSVLGVQATVLATSATRLSVVIPEGTTPCLETALQPVEVATGALTATYMVAVRTALPLRLERGESITLTSAEQSRCVEVAAPAGGAARYMVAVINTSASATTTSAFELRGSGTGAMAGRRAERRDGVAGGTGAARPVATSAEATTQALPDGMAAAQSAHDEHLEAQRALSASAGSAVTAWRQASLRRTSAVAASRSGPALGDIVVMRAPYGSCSTGREVRARVVHVGQRAVLLEDVSAPKAGAMDAEYRAIGEEFDAVHYPLLRDRIGDPLAMEATMQGDGRVAMLFTRFLNDSLPGIAGYVSACNFYPRSTFAASNEDAVLYARVASAVELPSEWRRAIRSTVVHEAKHLASFAVRFIDGTPFEEPWLEEATARIAEELYSRRFAGGGNWKGNTAFASSVRCELLPCDDRPLIMWKHFSALHQYLQGVDTLTPIGAATASDISYYGSGWSLVRWAADHHATDEASWLRQLVRGGTATGLANLAQRTGRPAAELLGDWALAHAVQGLAGFRPQRRELTFPSWNVADVMSGLASTFPGIFVASPLHVRSYSFGALTVPNPALRAFSASYVAFEGTQTGSQLLELRAVGGGAPPAALRLAVIRVE